MKLTHDQEKAFNQILSGNNVFITGGGGVGKTYLLKTVINGLKKKGKKVIVCAPTGTAAVLIGGATLHRTFNMENGVSITPKTKKLQIRSPKTIQYADIIIIDEISMCRMDHFDSIMASIKKAEEKRGSKIQVIVFGDFLQLPPVLDNSKGEKDVLDLYYGRDVGHAFAFQGEYWQQMNFTTVLLTEVVRQADPILVKHLEQARFGDPKCLSYFLKERSPYHLEDSITLAAKKKRVNEINEKALKRLLTPEIRIEAKITGTVTEDDMIVPQTLILKEGALVTTAVNDSNGLYVNGSQGTVDKITRECIWVKFPHLNNRPIRIDKYHWEVYAYSISIDETISRERIGIYEQYPLRLAYASTIHRAQGATYSKMELDPEGLFAPGQLYVALSRVRHVEDMRIRGDIDSKYLMADPAVVQFYKNLREEKEKRSKGRPSASYGETKPLRIPVELHEIVNQIVSEWKDIGAARYNQTFMMVPKDLEESIKEFIEQRERK